MQNIWMETHQVWTVFLTPSNNSLTLFWMSKTQDLIIYGHPKPYTSLYIAPPPNHFSTEVLWAL